MAKRREWTGETLAAGVREGDRRALARAITLVENGDPLAYGVVADLYPSTGNAYAVGITGPPGVGKSSLISALVRNVRAQETTVGVVSVDPSSPFSKGALLGDRIRLADHFLDPGVFIRSMGTRGHLGGLAEATLQALLVLDAAGKDVVFLETVGAGQSEVEVIGIADTVVLVLMPGSGDSVQALKAGIMEIPDVIAINKMDHPAAKTMLNEVRSILALDRSHDWNPPIVLTEAVRGEHVPELWEKIEEHRASLEQSGQLEERRRANGERGQPRPGGRVGRTRARRARADLHAPGLADGQGRRDPKLRRRGRPQRAGIRGVARGRPRVRRGRGSGVHPSLPRHARDVGPGNDRARARGAGRRARDGGAPDRRRRARLGDLAGAACRATGAADRRRPGGGDAAGRIRLHDRRRDRGQGAGRGDNGDPRRDARRYGHGRRRAD